MGEQKWPGPRVGRVAALRAYCESMAEADALFPTDPARAVENAACAAMELNHQLGVRYDTLAGLVSALDGHSNGRATDWLKPTNFNGTSALTIAEKGRRAGIIATTIRLLDEPQIIDAHAIVADALNKANIHYLVTKNGRKVTPQMIRKWRERRHQYSEPDKLNQMICSCRKLSPALAIENMIEWVASLR